MCGLDITLGVTLSADYSCGGDRGLLALPYENIGEACTRKFTGDANFFSIAKISVELLVDPMFIELAVIILFD